MRKQDKNVYVSLNQLEIDTLKNYISYSQKVEYVKFMEYTFLKTKLKTAREIYNNLCFMGDESVTPIKAKFKDAIFIKKENK